VLRCSNCVGGWYATTHNRALKRNSDMRFMQVSQQIRRCRTIVARGVSGRNGMAGGTPITPPYSPSNKKITCTPRFRQYEQCVAVIPACEGNASNG
jgi:hypothetical protein